jgi:secondary thiamine-phosphate synthase enzyme
MRSLLEAELMLTFVEVDTPLGESLTNITDAVVERINESGIKDGICVLFVPHTTAAITLNSALDKNTAVDIIDDLQRLVPKRVDFAHQYDTPADAAGHIKAALVGHSATLVIADGRLTLGGSQSILFYEFDGPRKRRVQIKLIEG